ncbi:ATPase [Candidatus Uhrbacteria bacterium]|nr:ATPase [Candidatus Uhrbacteria bacterium]
MAQPTITITKANGERQRFSMRKLERSIRRSGASRGTARATVEHVARQLRDGMTTAQIFALVRQLLQRGREHGAAARYSLKDAMHRLGPAGYDFEKYVAEILRAYGYDAVLPDLIPGMCVKHEVDVVARRDGETAMAECKYRNAPGLHVHLKDVMATWARYEDLREAHTKRRHRFNFTECWIVCNTKITGDGLRFGTCKGMRLIGWQYPRDAGLERMIEEKHLYPITVLRSLTPPVQERLAAAGIMLCHDIAREDPTTLSRRADVPLVAIERIRSEITEVLKC